MTGAYRLTGVKGLNVENILSDLIRIQTVNPPGGELALAKYLKDLFDRNGIANEIIESSPERASFFGYLGEGTKSMMFLSHTDVVPATDGWSFPPFSGEIKDGFIHGRGALDCKGLVSAEAFAMIRLAQEKKLKGRLVFAATADEETGGTYGVRYLVQNHRDKFNVDFAVNEGAEPPINAGGITFHFIGTGEKGLAWVKMKAKGFSAHGSLPMLGDNAVTKMANAIKQLAEYQPEVVLIPEVKRIFSTVAEQQGLKTEITRDSIDKIIVNIQDRTFASYLSSITRMTVSPNVVHGGVKTNIIPDLCEAEVDVRFMPGQDRDFVLNELRKMTGDMDMEIIQYNTPTTSDADTEYYRVVAGTLKEFTGGSPVVPSISSGGTDSRFLRDIGIPSYGVGVMTFKSDQTMRQAVHGKDEKLDVESLRLKSDFLKKLAENYLTE
jgi:acetylornithine deacetylase/succinyl-diaminopimelate desuccinylase-like protein